MSIHNIRFFFCGEIRNKFNGYPLICSHGLAGTSVQSGQEIRSTIQRPPVDWLVWSLTAHSTAFWSYRTDQFT